MNTIDQYKYYCECFSFLKIDITRDQTIIKKAYKKLALKYHPDKGGCTEKFKQLGNIYEYLINIAYVPTAPKPQYTKPSYKPPPQPKTYTPPKPKPERTYSPPKQTADEKFKSQNFDYNTFYEMLQELYREALETLKKQKCLKHHQTAKLSSVFDNLKKGDSNYKLIFDNIKNNVILEGCMSKFEITSYYTRMVTFMKINRIGSEDYGYMYMTLDDMLNFRDILLSKKS